MIRVLYQILPPGTYVRILGLNSLVEILYQPEIEFVVHAFHPVPSTTNSLEILEGIVPSSSKRLGGGRLGTKMERLEST
jgi:hypothetical protein